MIGLSGGVFDGGKNIFLLKKRVVGKNLFKGSFGSQQFQSIRHTDSESAYAGAASAFTFFHRNALDSLAIHNSAL
jgi:hypothetical protein